ncbi:MAG: ExbD/TolR family protein [Thermonemataceae bacterium]
MKRTPSKHNSEVNTSAVADIAFLLLIFFLVAATFPSDKGLVMILPPDDEPVKEKILDRNLLVIAINENGEILMEKELVPRAVIQQRVKTFISNEDADKQLSSSPQEATIAIEVARGTHYKDYIYALDQIKAAYHSLRAEALGWSVEEYLSFKVHTAPVDVKERYYQVNEKYPIRITEAPTYQHDQ